MIGRGPQVLLDGAAALAARGGAGRTMRENIAAKQALEAAGVVSDGNSVDGRSITGVDPEDYFLAGPQQVTLPIGTTGERPSTGDIGQMRFNSTTGLYEVGLGGSWGNLLAGAAPAYGTDVGEVPVFENYQGSGFAALGFPTRLIVYKSGTTSGSDFAVVNVQRTTNHAGGAGGSVATSLRVGTTIGAGVSNQEWALLSAATTSSTAGGAAVGGDFQGIRTATSSAPIWGGIFNAIDQTGAASSSVLGAILAGEIDIRASGADDGGNGATFGGLGLRKGLQFNIVRHSESVDLEVSHGAWFSTQEPTHSTYLSTIGFAIGTQTYQALDTRGAVAPASGIMAAVRMDHDQIIDFNGGPALKSEAGNYLQYRAATSRLYYVVAGVDKFSIDASGNVRAAGTLTGSTTP